MVLGPVSKALPLAFAITRPRSIVIAAAAVGIAFFIAKNKQSSGDPVAPAAKGNLKRQDPEAWTKRAASEQARIRLEKAASAEDAELAVAGEIYSMSPSTALAFLTGPEPKKAGVSAPVLAEAVAVVQAAAAAKAAFGEAVIAAELYHMGANTALLYLSSDAPELAGVSSKAVADSVAVIQRAL